MLADRLHKTPSEIREGFTYPDYIHFLAHMKQEAEAVAEAVAAAKARS